MLLGTLGALMLGNILTKKLFIRAGGRYNNTDNMDKNFKFSSILLSILRLLSIWIENLDLMVFFSRNLSRMKDEVYVI